MILPCSSSILGLPAGVGAGAAEQVAGPPRGAYGHRVLVTVLGRDLGVGRAAAGSWVAAVPSSVSPSR